VELRAWLREDGLSCGPRALLMPGSAVSDGTRPLGCIHGATHGAWSRAGAARLSSICGDRLKPQRRDTWVVDRRFLRVRRAVPPQFPPCVDVRIESSGDPGGCVLCALYSPFWWHKTLPFAIPGGLRLMFLAPGPGVLRAREGSGRRLPLATRRRFSGLGFWALCGLASERCSLQSRRNRQRSPVLFARPGRRFYLGSRAFGASCWTPDGPGSFGRDGPPPVLIGCVACSTGSGRGALGGTVPVSLRPAQKHAADPSLGASSASSLSSCPQVVEVAAPTARLPQWFWRWLVARRLARRCPCRRGQVERLGRHSVEPAIATCGRRLDSSPPPPTTCFAALLAGRIALVPDMQFLPDILDRSCSHRLSA